MGGREDRRKRGRGMRTRYPAIVIAAAIKAEKDDVIAVVMRQKKTSKQRSD